MFEKGFYEMAGYKKYIQYPNYREKYLQPAVASVSQISMFLGLIDLYRFKDRRDYSRK